MKNKICVVMTALTCLCAGHVNTNAQEINIQNYCEDMARASRAGNDYIARCVATLEVQRKYQRQAEENARSKSREQQEYRTLKNRTDWTLALSGLYIEGQKAKTSEERDAIFIKSGPLFANDCQGMADPTECGELKQELLRLIGR